MYNNDSINALKNFKQKYCYCFNTQMQFQFVDGKVFTFAKIDVLSLSLSCLSES